MTGSTHPDTLAALKECFTHPDSAGRPTPFHWWSGADLDRERLAWQLDQLAEAGIGGTVVGYSHRPDGSVDAADPAPFTAPWWDLFVWFVGESSARGMTVGFQDYNVLIDVLSGPFPELASASPGTLVEHSFQASGPTILRVGLAPDDVVAARLVSDRLPGFEDPAAAAVLTAVDGELQWAVPDGNWLLSVVQRIPPVLRGVTVEFDVLHPRSGQAVIDRYYEPFAAHLEGELGRTFTVFFQDELDLGITMPMWNDYVAARLQSEYGFDPNQWLPALWHEAGPRTLEFRRAYKEVVISQLEDAYFRPVYEWHERQGTSLMMDQLSRGNLRQGREHYCDFMRAMSWYHGPGNDDPNLTGPRSVAAFKVSASIAHLHNRPLVVNEAFYGSGWGVTPSDLIAALNHGFACGVTHVILHGLYYTTEGGWWEWAAPDFHFRQPWFRDSGALWSYITRTVAVLKSGHHVCDVAILDPTIDLDLTGDGARSPEVARALLEELVGLGIDADLVDEASLTAASVDGSRIRVGTEHYRALVLPDMGALPEAVLAILNRFAAAGGLVVVLGGAPTRTERRRLTASDWALCASAPHATDANVLVAVLDRLGERHFHCATRGVIAIHRQVIDAHLFFITNTTDAAVSAVCHLDAAGGVEEWDLWTGERRSVAATVGRPIELEVALDPGQARLFVVAPSFSDSSDGSAPHVEHWVELDDDWELEVVPVLDNRFGDFELSGGPLGVTTWSVDVARQGPTGPWAAGTATYGPRLLVLGPVHPGLGSIYDQALAKLTHVRVGDAPPFDDSNLRWREYSLSFEYGLQDDPVLRDWTTGPHGLKGSVPDDFLDVSIVDHDAPPGSLYYFWTTVRRTQEGGRVIAYGSRGPMRVWLAGDLLVDKDTEQTPEFFPPFGIPDLRIRHQRFYVQVDDGDVLLVRMQRMAGQPSRAYVVAGPTDLDAAATTPGRLRWWAGDAPAMTFDPYPEPPTDVWLRAIAPPGAVALEVRTWGQPIEFSVNRERRKIDVYRASTPPGDATWFRVSLGGPVPAGAEVVLRLTGVPRGRAGAGILAAPLSWVTSVVHAGAAPWPQLGLADYSGVVRYGQDVIAGRAGNGDVLRLTHLRGAARVIVDGTVIGTVLAPPYEVALPPAGADGKISLVIEVANTLANHYWHYPSPYATMQPPGGGFKRALLGSRHPSS